MDKTIYPMVIQIAIRSSSNTTVIYWDRTTINFYLNTVALQVSIFAVRCHNRTIDI